MPVRLASVVNSSQWTIYVFYAWTQSSIINISFFFQFYCGSLSADLLLLTQRPAFCLFPFYAIHQFNWAFPQDLCPSTQSFKTRVPLKILSSYLFFGLPFGHRPPGLPWNTFWSILSSINLRDWSVHLILSF